MSLVAAWAHELLWLWHFISFFVRVGSFIHSDTTSVKVISSWLSTESPRISTRLSKQQHNSHSSWIHGRPLIYFNLHKQLLNSQSSRISLAIMNRDPGVIFAASRVFKMNRPAQLGSARLSQSGSQHSWKRNADEISINESNMTWFGWVWPLSTIEEAGKPQLSSPTKRTKRKETRQI